LEVFPSSIQNGSAAGADRRKERLIGTLRELIAARSATREASKRAEVVTADGMSDAGELVDDERRPDTRPMNCRAGNGEHDHGAAPADTKTRSALEISDKLAMLLRRGAARESNWICDRAMSAAEVKLDHSLELFADV